MKIGVILPHSKLYGGVKRFLELGNLFIRDNHEFTIFNEHGDKPDWFDFKGEITRIEKINQHQLDALFFTETKYYNIVAKANTKQRIFYFVKSGEKLKEIIKDSSFQIFTNSTNLFNECNRRYGVAPYKALGGIDTQLYRVDSFNIRQPGDPFVIIAFGRLNKKRKGTKFIVKACEKVAKRNKNIKLILFDTPTDEKALEAINNFKSSVDHEYIINNPYYKNPEMFQRGHVYISAEYRTGYSNTSAEAMACGLTVIGTKSGTQDFLLHEETGLVVKRNSHSIAKAIERLMNDDALRIKLAKSGRDKILGLSWDHLYSIILNKLTKDIET